MKKTEASYIIASLIMAFISLIGWLFIFSESLSLPAIKTSIYCIVGAGVLFYLSATSFIKFLNKTQITLTLSLFQKILLLSPLAVIGFELYSYLYNEKKEVLLALSIASLIPALVIILHIVFKQYNFLLFNHRELLFTLSYNHSDYSYHMDFKNKKEVGQWRELVFDNKGNFHDTTLSIFDFIIHRKRFEEIIGKSCLDFDNQTIQLLEMYVH